MSSVWGLVDDRTGHTGQVLGVIAKLGLPYQLKRLEYNALGRLLPPRLMGASMAGLDRARSAPLAPPYPKLVIASGRRTVPVLRAIKKASPSTVTVYLMWPGALDKIDLIAAPAHDHPPALPHVISTLAPLHAVTTETLASARDAWMPQFAHLPRPWVAVCLGGDTKHGQYSPADWRTVISTAQTMAGTGSLLVTTSRRTPPEAIALIEGALHGPHLLHRWDVGKDNPYLGMLGAAERIIVTGDSLSMCAEACVTGKPVYIYAPEKIIPAKHQALHATLYERGMAKPLNAGTVDDFEPTSGLDEAAMVAREIRARFPGAVS
ncbi:MAG: nucleoside-diphosphate sugar epimerase [Azospirillum brasilense]|nr:MAG: nucleoside-diphosphate sugar epimerase [Azospirillum brasilense]